VLGRPPGVAPPSRIKQLGGPKVAATSLAVQGGAALQTRGQISGPSLSVHFWPKTGT
jgi:hypothetical protein